MIKSTKSPAQIGFTAAALLLTAPAIAQDNSAASDPAERAAQVEAQMNDDERVQLTLGHMAAAMPGSVVPEGARPGAGFIPGIERLGVPSLYETDASLGVTWVGGARGSGGTQLPSGTAQGATWNESLIERGGQMIGGEARAKGFNIMLAGGINLMRDPRNGRTFEYLGEDPLHSGVLGGAAVRGIQSNNIISTVKHFAINPQETGRAFMNTVIAEDALRESDLLAFEIAIERGNPGAIMCAYNATNGPLSCGNHFLLTQVLREDWDYHGFVMSDWGAVDALDFALAGLDQQSGSAIDPELFFGEQLKEAAQSDPAYRQRLGEMTRNILYSIYDNGLDKQPLETAPELTATNAANSDLALAVAHEGIVLLSNQSGFLPLSAETKSILVIGGHADAGTPIGGGSSKVLGDDGPSISIPVTRDGTDAFASMLDRAFNHSSPLQAIRAAAPDANVIFRDGRYASEAALAASQADIVIIFANQYQTEGFDNPDLSLPDYQDLLIAEVAKANPNTMVVLQTGGPVTMPWKDDVMAVVEAWYSGARGGEAIADILFGAVNPSGHLPISFPQSATQLPRPTLDGLDSVEPNFGGAGKPGQELDVDYNIEGSDVGYRWYSREGTKPLFPFGHGLSYTSFAYDEFEVVSGDLLTARVTIRNTGERSGADVVQIYLTDAAGNATRRLVGFTKVDLQAGEAKQVDIPLEWRVISEWADDRWNVAKGRYQFVAAQDGLARGISASITLPNKQFGK